ncbi:uncharacterized protein PV06_04684 [Exophiala oligosperma]|uniref:Uncharacterized protein n=1 Tax=Exophiala oligosperma TaxID=215243 RepID=A0A0D2C1L7_9EURO|nr:uncharacterized protein PV06_04684 [Exophiala oligosperma]KIW43597.1 hypothetical protein PV06_04684 [Exophiala oligosperma]
MASREDYSVGWICALPIEVAAAKAAFDRIHDPILSPGPDFDDINNYILGSVRGHNVVLVYPRLETCEYGQMSTSLTKIATQLHATFKSVRFNLMVGVAGGVPGTKEDIRLGDVVVSKSNAGRHGVIEYDTNGKQAEGQAIHDKALSADHQPSPLLLAATGKAETAAIFDESQVAQYISDIIRKDPTTFAYPGPEQDILFESDYDHTTESEGNGCDHCNPDRIRPRQPRDEPQDVMVHYGLVASSHISMRHGVTRDKIAHEQGVLCFETEAAGLEDASKYLIIRGICDYADSHTSNLWHAYAAAAAAAYAKEVLSFIPTVPKRIFLAPNTYSEAAPEEGLVEEEEQQWSRTNG